MYILGLSSYVHDSAACLMKDGEIVAAAEEERFNREKHTNKFPENAVRYCLDEAGISLDELDFVGFYWIPWKGIFTRAMLMLKDPLKAYQFIKGPRQRGRGDISTLLDILAVNSTLKARLGARKPKYRFMFLDHHICHAADTFFSSEFNEAGILTADAVGEITSTLMGKGEGGSLSVFGRINYPDSLGMVYLTMCPFLGFDEDTGSGKIMGLSSYGEPRFLDTFRDILRTDGRGGISLNMSYFNFQYNNERLGYFSEKMEQALGRHREPGTDLEQRHMDIAASLQKRLEEAGLELARHVRDKTGSRNLCLSGGVALNGVLNGRILEEGIFDNLYIPPAPNDSGAAVGAAHYIHNVVLGRPRVPARKTSYYGPGFTDEECEAALKAAGLAYEKLEDPARTGAELLASQKIIGWFQGRMEFGPRALGNRSILADPRQADMKDILNRRVKFREDFRPFAPAVLKEYTGEYFEFVHDVPFMSIVFKVKEDKRSMIPAVVHVDGTGRLQTVEEETNPAYRRLISEFHKITGIPVILNTSFNIKGEPIVCTPEHAVAAFKGADMDCLIIGSYMSRKDK